MARRSKGRPVDGIVLLHKPEGISSNKALQQAKGIYFAQKAGHTGALDPLATGMLPICFGEATKFTQFLLDTDKTYVVRAKLGERTTTSDSDGEVVETRPVDITLDGLQKEITGFLGETDQYPSMYSALKYQGQPLYKYAREGIEVPRKCRKINVYSLTLDEYDAENEEIQMTAHVSKGTYIRTIVDDLGEKLGCGAHVIMLHRSKVGHYPSEQMVTIEQLEEKLQQAKAEGVEPSTYLDELLLPMDTALVDLPVVEITAEQGVAFSHGQVVVCGTVPEGIIKVVADGRFIGIGERNPDGHLKAKRALATNQ
ncbi:tRNA pseudouridine(55) synthase TruB [Pseudoalteromonas citrea]|uniref:tRNA pseudouridine synthase B n=1 Tax=Pseudoalteromonas citrea TaxID=43655 RepID=A0A5S3XM26_9GAMM|nr:MULTISPECIES: tRNA pseudouridine(55) synthase TruB [Pseudoalteromonas]RJE77767.1 tRNA pseudouridine(55) synthase TruB [Pseudoalteromonas sp. MSK9-3]TMP40167.1 tRNA pseudouridine(55) synthase TruB [Pseudoalteromonas citrea]TMP56881.1 tRNA pseudouridine(55) synthase TruB [Pseudoalteromonas citrea]